MYKFQLKIYVLLFLTALGIIGCKSKSTDAVEVMAVYKIDANLKQYVDAFFKEAKLRNIEIPQDNLIVKDSATSNNIELCGTCSQDLKKPTKQRIIEINTLNTRCWRTIPETNREALVFHELGHCLLKRIEHKNELFVDGSPKSIMVANDTDLYSPCVYVIDDTPANCNKTARRKYYIDELFDTATPVPVWAK
jgi:hypothetical protein